MDILCPILVVENHIREDWKGRSKSGEGGGRIPAGIAMARWIYLSPLRSWRCMANEPGSVSLHPMRGANLGDCRFDSS